MSDENSRAAEVLRENASKKQAAVCDTIKSSIMIFTDPRTSPATRVGWTKITNVMFHSEGVFEIIAQEEFKTRGVQIQVTIPREAVAAMVALLLAK